MSRRWLWIAGVLAALVVGAADDGWVTVAPAGAPPIRYRLAISDSLLGVTVAAPKGAGDRLPKVTAGLWLSQAHTLLPAEAQLTPTETETELRYTWSRPRPAGFTAARLAVVVEWPTGPGQPVARRERYLHLDGRAPHAPLGEPTAWAPLDLDDYAAQHADRAQQLAVPVAPPAGGKVTVVIADAAGRRVRNLVSGLAAPADLREVTWDGLDDEGRLVAPGEYAWTAATHVGLRAAYQYSFANGDEAMLRPFGTNHSVFLAAATNGKEIFAAAPLTEGGYAMIALNPAGAWQRGYDQIHGTGIQAVAIAADEQTFYAAHDGPGWGTRTDKTKPDWQVEAAISLTRYDVASARSQDYPDKQRFAILERHAWGPGAAQPALRRQLSLTGMALLGGKLYLGSRAAQGLLVVDPATAQVRATLPLPEPGAVAAAGDALLAVSGRSIVRLDPATGAATTWLPAGDLEPRGVAVAPDGRVYVTDGASHTIRVFSAAGQPERTLGVPGGPYAGPFVPERLVEPRGLTVLGDRLWVAEQRTNPKRFTAFDLASGKVVVQKFGNPPYGGPGAGMDPRQPSRWLGLQAGWELDHAKGTARCTSVLQKEAGHIEGRIEFPLHYRFVHLEDGRTLLLGQAKAVLVSELRPDGSVRDLAMVGGTHLFCYACGWDPPPAYREAFAKAFPDKPNDVAAKGPGVLWLDRNGDGACQVEEFEFTPANIQFAGGYWGNGQSDLTLRFPARRDGQAVLITLQPDGFLPSGAPNYPSLAAACQAAVPLELDNPAMVTTADRFGNLLVSGEPWLTGHGPDGRTLWRFPNRWVNVHGSHPAPLPEPGVMQGNLFFLGPAPLDAISDVTVLVGNHGRHFVVTSDGLYLDELFTDVRLSRDRDAQLVGGEPFGGSFAKGDDGIYYLQTGGSGYRLYHLEGLDSLARTTGRLTVTAEHLAAAERQLARQRTAARAAAPDQASPIAWTRDGKFPATVEFAVVGEDLRLRYTVADDSPWVNQGRDWTVLFKTGDAVDFQFAADSAAPAKRREPVPGDRRLLVAPSAEGNVAVLYDFRVPGTTAPVQFASPARSVAVDRVVRLERAKIAIEKRPRGYVATVTVPLADLGLTPQVAALRGDVGVIYGDREGTLNLLRSYWANPATALVNDVPSEAMLQPERWGTLRFGGAAAGWTLRAVGVLGNSGEEGEALVRFGAKPARGMGVAVDGSGAIWDRGGDRTLLRYAPDGRLLGSYPLPSGSDTRDRVTLAGDWLVLLLGGQLYRLPVSAAPGTTPESLKLAARTLSASSYGGKVAFASETELGLLDPASGERTVLGQGPQDKWSDIELLPDGKVVVPRELRDSIGERPQFLGGWWYGALWHGTIRRHDASLAPAPGVVLGGSSGYFIGHVAQNTELENCRGLGLLPDGHFAASGLTGVLHLLRWVEAEKRFTIVRRLGALADVRGLAIDRQGRIFCDRGVWQWDDAPAAPMELGIASAALGMPLVAGDLVAGPGVQYGDRPRWLHGTLDAELTTASLDGLTWDKPLIGTVSWLERNVRRALPLDETGTGPLLQLGGKGEPHKLLGRLALAPAEPVARFTSVTQLDDDTVIAAAAGQVLVFARQEGAWRETKRWRDWPGDHFGERLFLAASDGRLWVADTERHRVLVFGTLGAAPLAQAGTADRPGNGRHELTAPEVLSAAGERAVVYDRGNQRLVRLLLVAQPSETVTATGGR